MIQLDCWDVELGSNGAVLVRVHSVGEGPDRLPDAVFTFRVGDPQYDRWKQALDQRLGQRWIEVAGPATAD